MHHIDSGSTPLEAMFGLAMAKQTRSPPEGLRANHIVKQSLRPLGAKLDEGVRKQSLIAYKLDSEHPVHARCPVRAPQAPVLE